MGSIFGSLGQEIHSKIVVHFYDECIKHFGDELNCPEGYEQDELLYSQIVEEIQEHINYVNVTTHVPLDHLGNRILTLWFRIIDEVSEELEFKFVDGKIWAKLELTSI